MGKVLGLELELVLGLELGLELGRQREMVALVLRRRREMGPYGRFRQRAAQWPSSPPLSTMW